MIWQTILLYHPLMDISYYYKIYSYHIYEGSANNSYYSHSFHFSNNLHCTHKQYYQSTVHYHHNRYYQDKCDYLTPWLLLRKQKTRPANALLYLY